MAERHGFSKDTIRELCDRVGGLCSNPQCRAATRGPHSDGESAVNLGVAAHVHAASPGGPRYDDAQSEGERRGVHNGLWLCQTCAKLIDSDAARFHAPLLRAWRAQAELEAFERLGKPAQLARATGSPSEELPMSVDAVDTMRMLGRSYIEAGFPPCKLWSFTPADQDDPTFGELRALGLVYFGGPYGGPWFLTEAGVKWILRNRATLDDVTG